MKMFLFYIQYSDWIYTVSAVSLDEAWEKFRSFMTVEVIPAQSGKREMVGQGEIVTPPEPEIIKYRCFYPPDDFDCVELTDSVTDINEIVWRGE